MSDYDGKYCRFGQSLSKREMQVHEMIVEQALSYKIIADKLGITVRTVKFHVRRLHIKLGVKTALEMTVKHYKNELKVAS